MSTTTTEETVLSALRRAGGEATMDMLQRDLGVHRDTVRKRLQPLLDRGLVESRTRGRYRLTDRRPFRSSTAQQLVEVLQNSGYEAHITGFDLLVPFAHQFVYQFPHLIYADPTAVDAVEAVLTEAGFFVIHAGPRQRAVSRDLDRVVVLRAQPASEQYGVHDVVARPEKAWVDTLRETVRGNLDLSFLELGRALRALVDEDADLRYLRRYARKLGYLDRVQAAMSETAPIDARPESVALHAGYLA